VAATKAGVIKEAIKVGATPTPTKVVSIKETKVVSIKEIKVATIKAVVTKVGVTITIKVVASILPNPPNQATPSI